MSAVTIPARELRVWHRPRMRRHLKVEWHAIMAESLRLGDDDAVVDLQGAAERLWNLYGDPPDHILQPRMREVRRHTKGQPFVLETKHGPLFVTNALHWFFNGGRWNGDWRTPFVKEVWEKRGVRAA